MSHMERVGVRELRLNASRYVERVEAGETIEITKRGRVVGRLTPVPADESGRDYLIATGQLRPGTGGLRDISPATTSKGSVSAVLAAQRDAEHF